MRRNPGTATFLANFFAGTSFQPRTKRAAKTCLFATLLLLWSSEASAQGPVPTPPSTRSQEASSQGALPTPQPAPVEVPDPPVLPAPKSPLSPVLAGAPLPAALVPAIEARVGLSALSRVSSANNKILFKGINASITGQSSDHFGATLEVGYLRASNVFGTGQSNKVLTVLAGPAWYPYRRSGFVTSVHVLGGAARVSGVVVLTPSNRGFLKGAVSDVAWAFGTGLEKWFTESLAARVDIDGLHTSFYNRAVKVHGEYDLRATWGLIYYFGGRRGGEFRSFAGKQIE